MRPGEVLETVRASSQPASGEGKANQYYLRGFNLDHGTDFATTVGEAGEHADARPRPRYSDSIPHPGARERRPFERAVLRRARRLCHRGHRTINYTTARPPDRQVGGGRAMLDGSSGRRPLGGRGTLLGALELERSDGPGTADELRKFNGRFATREATRATPVGDVMGYRGS